MMVSAGGGAAAHTNWFGSDAECPLNLRRWRWHITVARGPKISIAVQPFSPEPYH